MTTAMDESEGERLDFKVNRDLLNADFNGYQLKVDEPIKIVERALPSGVFSHFQNRTRCSFLLQR